jgi:fatty acid desaturase
MLCIIRSQLLVCLLGAFFVVVVGLYFIIVYIVFIVIPTCVIVTHLASDFGDVILTLSHMSAVCRDSAAQKSNGEFTV